jgi:hypothetical protein
LQRSFFYNIKQEESANVEKYVAALKFSSLLITTTHATKYTYINEKFLIWWECASTAEKFIFEKFIFTMITIKHD